jgi:hypothetical protein
MLRTNTILILLLAALLYQLLYMNHKHIEVNNNVVEEETESNPLANFLEQPMELEMEMNNEIVEDTEMNQVLMENNVAVEDQAAPAVEDHDVPFIQNTNYDVLKAYDDAYKAFLPDFNSFGTPLELVSTLFTENIEHSDINSSNISGNTI